MKIELKTYQKVGNYNVASTKVVEAKEIDARGSKRGAKIARSQSVLDSIDDRFARIAKTENGQSIKTYYERIEAKSTKQRNSRKSKRDARK